MSTRPGCCASLRLSARRDSPRRAACIRPPRQNSMERLRRCLRTRTPRSIPTVRMPSPSSTATGSSESTATPTTCSAATASCSTTRASGAARRSSRGRSPSRPRGSARGSRRNCTLATSRRCATGGTPRIMWSACGSSFRTRGRMTM